MSTQAFDLFSKMIISKTGNKELSELEMYYNSKMLSADVTAAVDPDYDEVSDVPMVMLLVVVLLLKNIQVEVVNIVLVKLLQNSHLK